MEYIIERQKKEYTGKCNAVRNTFVIGMCTRVCHQLDGTITVHVAYWLSYEFSCFIRKVLYNSKTVYDTKIAQ